MDPAQLQPGFRLDRYELLCPLAYGGMASVWLARFGGRRGFERLVVVKMILPQYSQDPRFQEMFLDEARIASRIEHGNVARILDVGDHEENTFIVMEWVDGDSLSKVVRAVEQKKLHVPAGIALRIIADAAAGLHAAHDLKERDGTPLHVVHRDVSPQNILISNAGTTVLIDFGVAKARDRVSQETSAGQLKGKIRYMAPEQALGRSVDHRADIWALGAILSELFAGVPPYDGPNEVATLHKLTSGVAPLPLPPSVPAAVQAVIGRALAYDPESRYGTALELNLALESALVEIGEPTSPAVVAHYTGQLLAERKNARKRAVDKALASAHARDGERGASAPLSTSPMVASDRTMPFLHAPGAPPGRGGMVGPPPPLSGADLVSSPSSAASAGQVSQSSHPSQVLQSSSGGSGSGTGAAHASFGPMGLGEAPSASSSTLGSAAMEYPPELVDDPTRRRRFIAAAVLGVSIAAGVVGAVLIISAAVARKDPPSTQPTLGATAQGTAPPEAIEPPATTPRSTVTDPSPTATTAATVAPVAPAVPSNTPATGTPPTVSPPTLATTAVTVTPTTAAPHRTVTPPPVTPPVRKPPTPPTTTNAAPTGKPDRGF